MPKDIAIYESKKLLRASLKKTLSAIPLESIALQSEKVAKVLIETKEFRQAKSVALYMNMPNSEVQTLSIIKHCFDVNKKVYLPRCNSLAQVGRKKNFLSMLRMSNYCDVSRLQPKGKYKLLEPIEGEDVMETGDLDLIVVPGVAFSEKKGRLGHGAGFYDEFLDVYSKKFNKVPFLVGIGLREQIVEDLPTEPHDWVLDAVIINGQLVL